MVIITHEFQDVRLKFGKQDIKADRETRGSIGGFCKGSL
jgi:hypothetical protein